MLLLDIETYQICGKSSIWDFAAIDTSTKETFHYLNSTAIANANDLLRKEYNVRFFEQHHVNYCIHNQTATRYNHQEFFNAIQLLIDGYKVISAYNVNFDYRELKHHRIDFRNVKRICLWGSFINSFVNNKYVKFCYDNEYLTPKGFIQTNAEVAYRYLTGNKGYIHQHTALMDCYSELEVWERIKTRRQKLESSCSFHNVKRKLKQLGYK